MLGYRIISDLEEESDFVRAKRYGVIETHAGLFTRLTLRPWPTLFSMRELIPLTDEWRPTGKSNRCRLYYNQPRGHSDYLALRYIACTPKTSYATFRAAIKAFDKVAEIKESHALLCDASNHRLSDRFLRRQGWEPHAPQWGRRNYIRRLRDAITGKSLVEHHSC